MCNTLSPCPHTEDGSVMLTWQEAATELCTLRRSCSCSSPSRKWLPACLRASSALVIRSRIS